MAISYAPFGDGDDVGDYRPKAYVPPPAYPKGAEDTTECSYVLIGFLGSIILLGIMDSLRK